MTKYITILSLLLLVSCATEKEAANNRNQEATRYVVSFYSVGAGVDTKAVPPFRAFIKEFETKNKVTINFETQNWGKEGETDFCFNLDNLSVKLKKQFIKESKEYLKDAEHIHFKENEPCKF